MLFDTLFLSILISFLRGGNLGNLVSTKLRASWAIVLGLGLQTILPFAMRTGLPAAPVILLFLAGYCLLLVPLWLNRFEWRLALVAIGILLNLSAFAANGGMPVLIQAPAAIRGLELASTDLGERDPLHVPMVDESRLKFLGDWVRVPRFSRQVAIVSPGDILVSLGAFLFMQRAMVYRGRRRADAAQAPGRQL